MRRIAIDTNVYVEFKKGNKQVISVFQNVDFIGIDLVVIAELLSGFRLGQREKENKDELNQFFMSPRVHIIEIDLEVAEYYALVVSQLRNKGKPIPTNDIWIAANSMRHGLGLYTMDKHFKEIEGLQLV
ncbi:MAG: type II toxin-antitoxin system VapC family toxin [Candidatus Margulisiibacteriota bacterium]